MDDLNKVLEGEKTDNLEGTSTSGEGGVELNNSPVPTPEEVKDAKAVDADNSGNAGDPEDAMGANVSDTPTTTANVESSEPTDGGAPATEEVNAPVEEPTVNPEDEPKFTQSQVNDLVGKTRMETREQTYRAIYGRYGVDDEAGMDELVGNAQRYETVRGEYDEARKSWEQADVAKNNELTEVKEHVALLESGIVRERFDDAKAILKAKGLEVTVENINNEIATHPEWKGTKAEEPNPNFRPDLNKEPQTTPTPESTIKVLGNDGSSAKPTELTEEEQAMALFKFNK